ncbi:probable disease resistance protein At1g12280 [Momordica charantia]|uniref:Probable disease resistance protein At1g12280 n=1 Tax=Momordica charantia TaxID=3673 RepID=A0A6J1DBH9_MOMCH|nr:probable disease resistance protein At1g12280 [Momordica charantia]
MEILSSIIGKFVELTVEPIVRELCYPCMMSRNIEKLKNQVEMLKETRDSVRHMVDAATRNVEDIKPAVLKWLGEVDDIIKKSEEVVNASQQVRLCSNLVQRHKLSKKAKKMAEELRGMKEEAGSFNNGVSYNAHVPLENPWTKIPDFLYFESRKWTMKQITDALSDNNVNMIGVYGMGGVGKTMLVKEISKTVMEKKLLAQVITLTVSQTQDLKNIQGQIANTLDLKFDQETVLGRALKLHKRLKMENNILIVFDDIWEHIDLETIGIPLVADHTGCKLLFTCRDKHVLSNEMCINKIFEIEVLGEDES